MLQPLVAGGLAGFALALLLLALSHRWERRLLLVAAASASWAGLLALPWTLPLQAALALSLMALLLRQAELRHPLVDLMLLLPVGLGLVLHAWDPQGLGAGMPRGLTLLLGAELLLIAGVFLWRRWRLCLWITREADDRQRDDARRKCGGRQRFHRAGI